VVNYDLYVDMKQVADFIQEHPTLELNCEDWTPAAWIINSDPPMPQLYHYHQAFIQATTNSITCI
jgi:hypothetical protein